MAAPACLLCRTSPAEFTCSCAIPPSQICSACIVNHLRAAGTHIPLPLARVADPVNIASGNEVCDECRRQAAVRFCLCAAPVKKFCDGCDYSHYQKAAFMFHFRHPIAAYQSVASGRVSIETFKKKQMFINDLQLRISENVSQLDMFAQKVEGEFNALIQLCNEKKDKYLRELQTQRGVLVTAVQEALQIIDAKRYQESFEVSTWLESLVLNGFQSESLPAFQLFNGSIEIESIRTLLEKSVTYKTDVEALKRNSEQLQRSFENRLPVIKGNNLRLYNLSDFQMTQATLSVNTNINNSTAYCFVGIDTLLCCGGESHSEVYEVNIKTYEAKRVANMNSVRRYSGIWNYNNHTVFIFGGFPTNTTHLQSGEKYSLSAGTWTFLRETMKKEKTGCSVCEHEDGLYVSGIHNGGGSLEHFNPETETFKQLFINSSPLCSLLFAVEGDLVILRGNQIEVAKISGGNEAFSISRTQTFSQIGNGNYWLSCPLRGRNGHFVSVLNPGYYPVGIFKYVPASNQFSQVLTFAY